MDAVIAGLFDCVSVAGGGEDAERGGVAVCAKSAMSSIGEAAACGARGDFFVEIVDRFAERFEDGGFPGEEFESEPFGSARADAGEFFQVGDER